MDEELVADRLTELRTKTTQLRIRRDDLTLALDDEPNAPEPATLAAVADHITEIIAISQGLIEKGFLSLI